MYCGLATKFAVCAARHFFVWRSDHTVVVRLSSQRLESCTLFFRAVRAAEIENNLIGGGCRCGSVALETRVFQVPAALSL
jgi:hypothetical protein